MDPHLIQIDTKSTVHTESGYRIWSMFLSFWLIWQCMPLLHKTLQLLKVFTRHTFGMQKMRKENLSMPLIFLHSIKINVMCS